ncbi:substrate-binding domain-containing protein [Sinisalibacter aestuarii]|uniref:LacI family transcriptional regulator n=1 Tax=Sinisalibacter aestuarii TaxID=2949426 RepID=A0ABQ5LRS5_9RHOB|nr:substrate-binding domain-containing protein [Sinisalibacter aestuarii]GKY87691.1 LacI family transcriptional regulator [Sinisalibacter aestuarii]
MKLKELSELLHLSQTTVSRALNGYPEVSEATRKRVQAAAAAHGYRPNIRARSLATGRALAIGHVIPLTSKHEMVNPIFADFIAGAGEVYSARGYDMLLSLVADEEQEHAYRELKTKGAVDGLIIHAPRTGDRRIHLLNEIGLPFVVHGRATDADEPYCWVDMNNTHAFRRATDLLLDLGHRRIALVNGLESMDFAQRRRAGFEEAHAARGLAPDPALMSSDEMTEGYGHDTARALLAADAPPTAFLVSSIITAIGVRRAIEELGLRMGRDVSVITHDDDLSYLQNRADVPVFTATRSSVRDAGRRAASMLLDRIENPGAEPCQELFEAELLLGQSTGPLLESPPK